MASTTQARSAATAPLIADQPALDLLNTVAMVDGHLTDFLQSDADVLAWLAALGVSVSTPLRVEPGRLVAAARELRDQVRTAVERRAGGKVVRPAELNAWLRMAAGYPVLAVQRDGKLSLSRAWGDESAEQILGPIAESAADLLAHGDFDLVRVCEDRDCVLWFYDRTKSHRRRWCSVATCGNRHKVAAFRARKSKGKAPR